MASRNGNRSGPPERDRWEIWRDRIWTIASTGFVAILIWLDFSNDGTIQNQWLFIVLAAFGSGATTWLLYNWAGGGRRNDNNDKSSQ